MANYRNLSIDKDDAKHYEEIVDKWALKHDGVKLTLPRIIRLAMLEFEGKLDD